MPNAPDYDFPTVWEQRDEDPTTPDVATALAASGSQPGLALIGRQGAGRPHPVPPAAREFRDRFSITLGPGAPQFGAFQQSAFQQAVFHQRSEYQPTNVSRFDRIVAALLRPETLSLLQDLASASDSVATHSRLLEFLLSSRQSLGIFATLVAEDVIGVGDSRLHLTAFGEHVINRVARAESEK
jgi:hypothetical protein